MVQTASLHRHACVRGWSLAVQPNCLKGQVVCGTVYGEMHLKDLLGSIVRVGYCIPVPDFYQVLHGLRIRCRKKHYNGLISSRKYNNLSHQITTFFVYIFRILFSIYNSLKTTGSIDPKTLYTCAYVYTHEQPAK